MSDPKPAQPSAAERAKAALVQASPRWVESPAWKVMHRCITEQIRAAEQAARAEGRREMIDKFRGDLTQEQWDAYLKIVEDVTEPISDAGHTVRDAILAEGYRAGLEEAAQLYVPCHIAHAPSKGYCDGWLAGVEKYKAAIRAIDGEEAG